MKIQKYLSEFLGTFFLAGVMVLISSTVIGGYGFVVSAIVLGFIAYTLGPISGAHVNPAISIGQAAAKRIGAKTALWYIVAQAIAGLAVFGLGIAYFHIGKDITTPEIKNIWLTLLAEVLGSFIFAFGVASVVFGKVEKAASGLVIGGSLLVGSMVAQMLGAQGILNPAVAYAVNMFSTWQGIVIYGLGPIAGAKLAMLTYGFLTGDLTCAMYKKYFVRGDKIAQV